MLPVFFMYNSGMQPSGFLIMGVSGSGKSTLGQALAGELGWDFFDADDYHSVENISKMAAGIPLTDLDREPWLSVLNRQLQYTLALNRHPVLACSALKKKYRDRLLSSIDGMAVVYLKGTYEQILSRLRKREGHYMKENMLQSQFEALEEPEEAIILDVVMPLDQMLDTIFRRYNIGKVT